MKRLGRKGSLEKSPVAFTGFMTSEDRVNTQGQKTSQLNAVIRRPLASPEEDRATVQTLDRFTSGSGDSSLDASGAASFITLRLDDGRNSERIKKLYQMPRDREPNEDLRRQVIGDLKSSLRAKLLAAGICSQKDLDEEDDLQSQCDELSRRSGRPKGTR